MTRNSLIDKVFSISLPLKQVRPANPFGARQFSDNLSHVTKALKVKMETSKFFFSQINLKAMQKLGENILTNLQL